MRTAHKPSRPFGSFFIIHFETGGDTKSLRYQEKFWPAATAFLELAKAYEAKLTLQFNPQWAEYIVDDEEKKEDVKSWQKEGHEIALHHHGLDHPDWNGYTAREGMEEKPGYRGNIKDMCRLLNRLSSPERIMTGTITDEEFDYPGEIRYDTEGIEIRHATTRPVRVSLGSARVVQVGMAYLPFCGDIEIFRNPLDAADEDEVFGLVTHEHDFEHNPVLFEEWFHFLQNKNITIRTVSDLITSYAVKYPIKYSRNPLRFSSDVFDIDFIKGE